MLISYELDLNTFKAWSGAVDTLNRIKQEDKCSELESILEDLYPEGMTETQLNDLLWFEPDYIYDLLDIRSENQIKEELSDAREEYSEIKSEIEDLISDYKNDCEGKTDSEKSDIWKSDYLNTYNELKVQKTEVKIRISELIEELENI